MRPKSRAPRLIRLPDTFSPFIPAAVISMVIGITAAVTSAARTLPSNKNRATMTSSAPSVRLRSTVLIVASTSFDRS